MKYFTILMHLHTFTYTNLHEIFILLGNYRITGTSHNFKSLQHTIFTGPVIANCATLIVDYLARKQATISNFQTE